MIFPALWASYRYLLRILIGSSPFLLLLWLVGVIALVLVFRQSFEKRSREKNSYTFCFLGFFLGEAASEVTVVILVSTGVAAATEALPFITAVTTALDDGAASLQGSLLILTGDIGAVWVTTIAGSDVVTMVVDTASSLDWLPHSLKRQN